MLYRKMCKILKQKQLMFPLSRLSLVYLLIYLWCSNAYDLDGSYDYSCYSYNEELNDRAIIIPKPKNSIKVQVNESIRITCHVNPSYPFDANDVQLRKVNINGHHELLKSEFIDEFTIATNLIELHPSKLRLDCGRNDSTFCSRIVSVGYPPMEVENLTCISYNWETLVCSFDLPENPAQDPNEDYILSYTDENFKSKSLQHFGSQCLSSETSCCYRNKQSGQRCWEWNNKQEHFFEKYSPSLLLNVSSANALGNRSYYYKINPFKRMIPDPVVDLVAEILSFYKIVINFKLPRFLETFPPGISYRIEYQSSFDLQSLTGTVKNATEVSEELNGLYPGHLYSITVQLRSAINTLKNSIWWSDPRLIEAQTPSTKPLKPPETFPGLFHSFLVAGVTSNDTLGVVVYWKHVEDKYIGGQKFFYRVEVYFRNERQVILQHDTTETYAVFREWSPDTDYEFVVISMNSEGNGPKSSAVYVPKESFKRATPTTILVANHHKEENFVEILWYTENHPEEGNMTVVWCPEIQFDDNLQICKKILGWKNLKWKNHFNLTSDELEMESSINSLRFGMIPKADSGLIWSSCKTILYSQPITQVHTPKFLISSDDPFSATLSWDLSCQDWSLYPVSITGSWHQVQSPDDYHYEVFSVWPLRVIIKDLQPNSNYTFEFTVNYKSGISSATSSLSLLTGRKGVSGIAVFVISFSSLFIFTILTCILLYAKRKLFKFWKDITMEINIPDGLLQPASKRTKKFEIHRSEMDVSNGLTVYDCLLQHQNNKLVIDTCQESRTLENIPKRKQNETNKINEDLEMQYITIRNDSNCSLSNIEILDLKLHETSASSLQLHEASESSLKRDETSESSLKPSLSSKEIYHSSFNQTLISMKEFSLKSEKDLKHSLYPLKDLTMAPSPGYVLADHQPPKVKTSKLFNCPQVENVSTAHLNTASSSPGYCISSGTHIATQNTQDDLKLSRLSNEEEEMTDTQVPEGYVKAYFDPKLFY